MCYDLALGSDCAHLVTDSKPLNKKKNEESDAGRTAVLSLLWVSSCAMDYDHHYKSHHHHHHHHHEGVQGSKEGRGCEPTWVLSEVILESTFCEQDELNKDNLVPEPEHHHDVSKGNSCGLYVFSRALVVHRGDDIFYDDRNNTRHHHYHHNHHHDDQDKPLQGSSECDDCPATLAVRTLMTETEAMESGDLWQGDLSEREHDGDSSEGSSISSTRSTRYYSSEHYDASVSSSSSSSSSSDVVSHVLVIHHGDDIDFGEDQDKTLHGSSECDDHTATWTVPGLVTETEAWEHGDLGLWGLSDSGHDDDDCGVSSSTSSTSSWSGRYKRGMGISSSSSNGSSCCSEHVEEQPEVHPVWQTEEFGLNANLWKGDEFGPGARRSDHGNPGGLGEDSTSSSCFKSDDNCLGSFWEAECDGLGTEGCCCCFCSEQLQQQDEVDDGCSSLWTVGGGFGWHTRKKSRLSTWTGGN